MSSVANRIVYRILVTVIAIVLMLIAKDNQPFDSVPCIVDKTLIMHHSPSAVALMELVVVGELVMMSWLCYAISDGVGYALMVLIVGAAKVLIHVRID